jgi:Ca-activated chloride channel family protein
MTLSRRLRLALTTIVAGTLAVSAAPAGQQTPPPQQPPAGQQTPQSPTDRQSPAFRAGVDLVSLNVSVTEGAKYLTDLDVGDFQVFEDGVLQEVTFFSRSQLPIALALLVDTSASMEGRLPTAQEAAVGFARQLRSEDLAEIVDFDSRVVILQPFTNDAAALEQAIRRTSAGGSTSMYNALYISLKNLKKIVASRVDEIRRQAIILLSDGEDTSSLMPFEEVLDLAKRSETSVYAIGLRGTERGVTRSRGFQEAEFVLRQITRETGGRAFFPQDVTELAGIYRQIAEELSSQYTLGYSSRNARRDGAWRRIVVRASRPQTVARTKQGYFGPTGKP